jgi:hypothetical protein
MSNILKAEGVLQFHIQDTHMDIQLQTQNKVDLALLVSSNDNSVTTTNVTTATLSRGHSTSTPFTITWQNLQAEHLTVFDVNMLLTVEHKSVIRKPIPLCPHVLLKRTQVQQACNTGLSLQVAEGLTMHLRPTTNTSTTGKQEIIATANTLNQCNLVETYTAMLENIAQRSTDIMHAMKLTEPVTIPIDANLSTFDEKGRSQSLMYTDQILADLYDVITSGDHDVCKRHQVNARQTASAMIQLALAEQSKLGRELSDSEVAQIADLFGQPGALSIYESDHATQIQAKTMMAHGKDVSIAMQLVPTDTGESWNMGVPSTMMAAMVNESAHEAMQTLRAKTEMLAQEKFNQSYKQLTREQQWVCCQFPEFIPTMNDLRTLNTELEDDCEDLTWSFIGMHRLLPQEIINARDDMAKLCSTSPHTLDKLAQQFTKYCSRDKLSLAVVFAQAASADSQLAVNSSATTNQQQAALSIRDDHTAMYHKMQTCGAGHACGAHIKFDGSVISVMRNGVEVAKMRTGTMGELKECTAAVATTENDTPVQLALNIRQGDQQKSIVKQTSAGQASSIAVSTVTQLMPIKYNATINTCDKIDPSFVKLIMASTGGMLVTWSSRLLDKVKAESSVCGHAHVIDFAKFETIAATFAHDIGFGAKPKTVPGTHLIQVSTRPDEFAKPMKVLLEQIFFQTRPQQLHKTTCSTLRTFGKPDKIAGKFKTTVRTWPAHLDGSLSDIQRAGAWNNLLAQCKVWQSFAETKQLSDAISTTWVHYIASNCSAPERHLLAASAERSNEHTGTDAAVHQGIVHTLECLMTHQTFDTQTQFLTVSQPLQIILDKYTAANLVCENNATVQTDILTCQQFLRV